MREKETPEKERKGEEVRSFWPSYFVWLKLEWRQRNPKRPHIVGCDWIREKMCEDLRECMCEVLKGKCEESECVWIEVC